MLSLVFSVIVIAMATIVGIVAIGFVLLIIGLALNSYLISKEEDHSDDYYSR